MMITLCQHKRAVMPLRTSTWPRTFKSPTPRRAPSSLLAGNRMGQCVIDLDQALRGIMALDEYNRQKAPKSAYRAPVPGTTPRIVKGGDTKFTKTDFERIMGTNDLVGIEYLDKGIRAAAAVARVMISIPTTMQEGTASGFLVAPRLLLTNRHVLKDIDIARASTIQFRYERDGLGQTKQVEEYKLVPDEVFILGEADNDDADFALVAVAPYAERTRCPLSTFGYLRLDSQPGKVDKKEFITIIQHPNGELKKISVRENELLEKGANDVRPVLLYRSDTAPGSSGSPCFNDQWQVVALHSKGVPKTPAGEPFKYVLRHNNMAIDKDIFDNSGELGDDDILWEANLGVRVSFIVDAVRKSAAASHVLVRDFLGDVQRGGAPLPGAQPLAEAGLLHRGAFEEAAVARFGSGYDPKFLGERFPVPLPKLGPKALRYGEPLVVGAPGKFELTYTHFSVIMNASRRLAFVSAANIDGAAKKSVERRNSFYADWRAESAQTDEWVYYEPGSLEDEFFDRGHLTRRDDVCWGSSKAEAKAASDESFAFPNVAPQHRAFNQSKLGGVWGQLENYVLDQTVSERAKVNVFNGPIFAFTDLVYKDIPIPKEFFKVIVVVDPASGGGELRSTAYIASQAELVADAVIQELARKYHLEVPRPFGKWPDPQARAAAGASSRSQEMLPISRPFDGSDHSGNPHYVNVEQVTVAEIERRTGLVFAHDVRNASVVPSPVVPSPARTGADAQEASMMAPERRTITSLRDVIL